MSGNLNNPNLVSVPQRHSKIMQVFLTPEVGDSLQRRYYFALKVDDLTPDERSTLLMGSYVHDERTDCKLKLLKSAEKLAAARKLVQTLQSKFGLDGSLGQMQRDTEDCVVSYVLIY